MKDKTIIKMWGISLIAILEGIALIKGIDGMLFSMVISVIAGITGYHIGKRRD